MAATPTVLESQDFPWLCEEPPLNDGHPGGSLVQRIALSYEVPLHFTRDVFSWENLTLVRAISRREPQRRHRVLVVVERAIADEHPCLLDDIGRYVEVYRERLMLACEPVVLEGGESVRVLHDAFRASDLDRRSTVVVVGGEALQDLVSYATATSRRGVRVVRCPTTVLAQAAVGTATFEPPVAVINDLEFLATASPRAALAGIGAAARIALARDASFFDWLSSHASSLRAREPNALATMVRRAAEHHLALEPNTRDQGDGEAAAVACAVDAAYSAMCGLLDHESLESILTTLEALGLPTYHPALESAFDLAVTLLEDIGRGRELNDVDRELSLRAIDWLRRRCG